VTDGRSFQAAKLLSRHCVGRLPRAFLGCTYANTGAGTADGESGQALVEAAIALPIIAAFVFTMIELCLLFYSYNLTSELAREGTRYAIVHGATCETSTNASCTASSSAINSYVKQLSWPNLGGGTITPTTTFPDGDENPGSRVKVQVKYDFPLNLPFLPQGTVSMKSTSVMYFIQ